MADVIAPPPERGRHDLVRRVEVAGLGTLRYEVEAPLLLDRLVLTAEARAAGLLLREIYFRAGHRGRSLMVTLTGRSEMSDAMADAGRLYRDALRAVPAMWRQVVIGVCCEDSGSWGLLGLAEGLTALADHFAQAWRQGDERLTRFMRRIEIGD